MSIHIIADSACDLPLSYFREHDVTFFPLNVHLDGKDYEDGLTIQSKTVYDAMRNGKAPKTSQVSPEYFLEKFTDFAKKKEKGIYIAFSSALSGTYQTAVMIRNQVKEQYPDFDLEIIDTKCASVGYGLVVQKAVELAETGASKEEIIEDIVFNSTHMEHLFTVGNLEYLARGGRISRTSAFVGGLLNIRPLLHVEDGKLIPLEKLRGKKKLVNRTLELMRERGVNLDKQTIGISHGDDLEAALEWKQAIQEEFGTTSFEIQMVSATIGAHSGPGTIAIFFLNKEKGK
ncbi:DegV family protein [Bacillus testis]|uniref:DegV family protein n=1 Tax=Bacillus testis TaxID=1622072 RepID=UPI00067F6401|nr:DegV family protein [Bacillus testis]